MKAKKKTKSAKKASIKSKPKSRRTVALKKRTPGALKGKIHVGPEFFDPIPLEDWGG